MRKRLIAIVLLVCLIFSVAAPLTYAASTSYYDANYSTTVQLVERSEDKLEDKPEDKPEIHDIKRYRRYRNYSSNGDTPWWVILVIIIILAVIFLYKKWQNDRYETVFKKSINTANIDVNNESIEPKDFTEQISGEIRKRDNKFSADKFIWLAENYFIAYMDTYNSQDLELLEELTTEDIFFDDKLKIEEQIQNGVAHKRKRISFKKDYIYKYEYNDKYGYATLYMKVKMIDYMENLTTGESYYGSKTTDVFRHYIFTLRRKLDEKTIIIDTAQSAHCPNCGSSIDAVIIGKCPYCGKTSKITPEAWKISAVRETNLGAELGQAGIFRIS